MAEFEEADKYLIELVEQVIKEHHPHLEHAHIGLMYRDEPAKSKGRKIYSKVKTVTEDMNVFIDYDFIIWFAKESFEMMSQDTRLALVDHTLCFCGGDLAGWYLNDPEIQEFSTILARHGYWTQQLQSAKVAIEEYGQASLFELIKKGKVILGSVTGVKPDLLERAKTNPEELAADLVEAAKQFVEETGHPVTIGELQRHFRIYYSHAARILEVLKNAGAEVKNE